MCVCVYVGTGVTERAVSGQGRANEERRHYEDHLILALTAAVVVYSSQQQRTDEFQLITVLLCPQHLHVQCHYTNAHSWLFSIMEL